MAADQNIAGSAAIISEENTTLSSDNGVDPEQLQVEKVATPSQRENIISLLENGVVPDNLQEKKITFRLVHDLELVVREEGLPVASSLEKALSLIDPAAKLPHMKNLLRKVDRHYKKNGDLDIIISDLYPAALDENYIGPACNKAGINSETLKHCDTAKELSEMIVAELEIYREKNGHSFADAADWIRTVTGSQDDILIQTLRSSLVSRKEKKLLFTRNKEQKKLDLMWTTPYVLPSQRCITSNTDKLVSKVHQLTEENKVLRHDNRALEQQLLDSFSTVSETEKELERLTAMHQNETAPLLQVQEKLNATKRELKRILGHYNLYNVNRRDLAHRLCKDRLSLNNVQLSEQVQKLQEEVDLKVSELDSLSLEVNMLKRSRKRYRNISQKLKTTDSIAGRLSSIRKNQVEKHKLQNELDSVLADMAKENSNNVLSLFVGEGKSKMYSDEVHECYMDISQYVSAKNISKVVASVLSILGKFDILEKDLPKATFCKLVRQEANIVSSRQVAEELMKTEFATQHSDGTTRDGQKVVDFEMTVESGETRTIGLVDVAGGDAETQLDALKFTLQKLSDLLNDNDDATEASGTEIYHKLVSKIKNTMGDQAASEKAFNHKLENFRAEILPEIVENWGELSEHEQQQMRRVNHFYCNLHALIGFADYSDNSLKGVEEMCRETYGQLGVESLKEFQNKAGEYSWGHTDSAVQRLIRTACNALCPGGDQKSGCAGHFLTYRKEIIHENHLEIKNFRANRFNILFECAAGLYYHRNQIKDMFLDGYVKASNKLLRAVLADIQCVPLLAGVRALGILHRHFTDQFWRLMECSDIHIIDLGQYIKTAFDALGKWKDDASPLLEKDMPGIFIKPNGDVFEAKKDHVFDALYSQVGEEMNSLTKQALQSCCGSMYLVMERRYSDYLHGKYSADVSQEIYNESRKTLKTNMVGENDFGFWDWVKKNSESIGVMSAEGKVMFRRNHTAKWLRQLHVRDKNQYKRVMKQARSKGRLWAGKYQKRSAENDRIKADRLMANQKKT